MWIYHLSTYKHKKAADRAKEVIFMYGEYSMLLDGRIRDIEAYKCKSGSWGIKFTVG